MPSVTNNPFMLIVIMLNVTMVSIILLSVVVPFKPLPKVVHNDIQHKVLMCDTA
jgi:hypothetical protein